MTSLPTVRNISRRVRRRGLRESSVRGAQRIFRVPLTLLAARVLRARVRGVTSIDDALDLAYGFSFCGIVFGPWQERSEIRGFLTMIAKARPRTIVEIGTSNGGSLFLLARVAAPDAVLVSIDLPHGEFGGGYPSSRSILYRSFASHDQRIELLRADSHDPATLDAARTVLGGREVDVLFIDGDHSYAGVKKDFDMYAPLVRHGGIVGFHDIVPASPSGPTPRNDDVLQAGEVPSYWAELRTAHDVSEFVEDWDSGRFGIGAIHLP